LSFFIRPMNQNFGSRNLTLFVSAIAWMCSAAWAAEKDWAHYRGPKFDGIVPKADVNPDNLKEIWKATVGTGFASIIVVDDVAYTMGNADDEDQIVALDAKTGKEKWRHTYPCALDPNLYEGGPNATPTYDDGKIYTLSRQGHVFCLDAASGKVIWSKGAKALGDPPTWGFSGAPTVVGDLVVLNIGAHGVALNKQTGKVAWKSPKGKAGYATPVPFEQNGKTKIAMFAGTELVVVEAESGKKLWSFPWSTNYDVNAAAPIVFDDKMFISSGYNHGGTLLDISGDQPKQLWENRNLKTQFNSAIYLGGYIYGISGDANRRCKLVCVDPADGELKWRESMRFGSMIAAGEKLLVLDERGNLFFVAANPEAYELLAESQIFTNRAWSAPTLVDGMLFARDARGNVVCLDLR